MAQTVNLDALIPREDFLASATGGRDAGQSGKGDASRTDLMKGEAFYLTLRKPDFQRETAAWSPEAIRDFIKAFIDGDLIPTVICWQSPARLTFVIDGAHRLSAIMAWLQDDYGDGDESIKFYSNAIPEEQKRVAEKTRLLVKKSVGKWKDYLGEMKNPGTNPDLTEKVLAVGNSKILLQWVPGQDALKAERAFLTINRSAVVIDPTELKILSARFKPEAITSRAIVRNATGYKYWGTFSQSAQDAVERNAKHIYKSLYSPPLKAEERTNELPIAGHGYGTQTLPLIFDFVNIANGFPVIDPSKVSPTQPKIETANEGQTLSAVAKAKHLADRMTGTDPSSLGLLPAVYFYASNSRHQPTSVLAMAALIMELEETDRLIQFTQVRANFENFLIDNKSFLNQLTSRYGSMSKGYRRQKDYLLYVVNSFAGGKDAESILEDMKTHSVYKFLVKEEPTKTTKSKEFSGELKDWAFLATALSKQAHTCHLCGARLDNKSMHLGHLIDRSIGGIGSGDNAAWEHPFCDSTYKPWLQNNAW